VLCLLLVVLWVRCNGRWERLYIGVTKSIGVNLQSGNGQITLVYNDFSDDPSTNLQRWACSYYSDPRAANPTARYAGFHFSNLVKNELSFGAPHWSLLAIAGFVTVSFWLRKRFSLRTLLIALTLVAMLLGQLFTRRSTCVANTQLRLHHAGHPLDMLDSRLYQR
jgi:hypothetical protein